MSLRITGSPFPSQSKAHFQSQILSVPSQDFKSLSYQKQYLISPVMPTHTNMNMNASNNMNAQISNGNPINRQLDFQLSPMQQLKEITKAQNVITQERTMTSESEKSTGRPSIQPISCQHLGRSSTQRLGESAILDLERRSSKGLNKENIPSSLNLRDTLKEKTSFLIKQFSEIEKANPRLSHQLSFLSQVVENMQSSYQQLFDQLTLWKNRCLELENRGKNENSEYQKLKGIMESLQQKMTVLVDENSKLNSQLLKSDHSEVNDLRRKIEEKDQILEINNQQIMNYQSEKDDMVRRFTYEREQLQEQYSQIQQSQNQQLYELQQQHQQQVQQYQLQIHQLQQQHQQQQQIQRDCNITNTSIISDKSTREVAYKLEQAEMKLITLQISHDNLKQELQHKNLDYKTIENLKDTIGILNTKIQELIQEKELLNQEIDNANEKIMQQQQNLQRFEQMSSSEINNLKSQLNSQQDQRKQVEQQLKNQQYQTEQIQEKCYKLEEQLNQLSKEAEYEKNKYSSEINRMNGQLDLSKKEFEGLQKHMKEALTYLKNEKDEMENKKNQEINSCQVQLQRVSQQNSLMQQEIQQGRQKYSVLIQEISELKERMDSRRMEEESSRVVSTAERALYDTQIQNLTDKNSENEQTIISLEHKSRNLENRLSQLVGFQEQVRFEQNRNDELKKQNQELFNQITQLQRQLEDLNQMKDQLNWKSEHLSSELNKRNRDYGEKTEELKLLARKQEEAMKDIEKLERKLLERMEFEVRTSDNSFEKFRF